MTVSIFSCNTYVHAWTWPLGCVPGTELPQTPSSLAIAFTGQVCLETGHLGLWGYSFIHLSLKQTSMSFFELPCRKLKV